MVVLVTVSYDDSLCYTTFHTQILSCTCENYEIRIHKEKRPDHIYPLKQHNMHIIKYVYCSLVPHTYAYQRILTATRVLITV